MWYIAFLWMMFLNASEPRPIVFKTTASKISFTYKKGGQSLNDAAAKTTKFAMNGEMYQEDYSPVGLYIENREIINKAAIVNNNSVNFGINPQAVFFIDTNGKAGMVRVQNRNEKKYKYAVEIAPMLIENGVVNPILTRFNGNTRRRNGIGITKDGQVVFIVALQRTTFTEFAQLFKDNDCISAAFVDGGISEYWTPTTTGFGGTYGVVVTSN
jgi:uncharacterized protein YigE (DUF2233 family)